MIAHEARRILRAHHYGALCTLSKKFTGYPFGSITPYLADHDGTLLILISALAEHTKNIQNDPRVSLIIHNQNDPHIQAHGRVAVIGKAKPEPKLQQVGRRYIRYFPEAQAYLGMGDFRFYRVDPVAIRYIGGFGKIHWLKWKILRSIKQKHSQNWKKNCLRRRTRSCSRLCKGCCWNSMA